MTHSLEFEDQLKHLNRLIYRNSWFRKKIDRESRKRLEKISQREGLDATQFYFSSIVRKKDKIYLAMKKEKEDVLICISKPRTDDVPRLFSNATGYSYKISPHFVVSIYILPFSDENLRRLIEEAPELGPYNFKNLPRLGLGVRMLFTLPGLLEGLEEADVLADFQLSAGREFSLTEVVKAKAGKYPEWLGHTGLDARTLYGTIVKECFKLGVSFYGTEIDHAIVTDKPEQAISRIRDTDRRQISGCDDAELSERNLEESMAYNRRIIDEAAETGFVRGLTTDTSALLREEVDDTEIWKGDKLRDEFRRVFDEQQGRLLMEIYHPYRPHIMKSRVGKERYEINFTEEDMMRLALKFRRSLIKNKQLYDCMAGRIGKPFSFEVSLDEAYRSLTTPKEAFFYLMESKRMKMPIDLIAPNVGFKKREDYEGSLEELEERVRILSVIASHFNVILDFHSGSDKRLEVYRTISKACGGQLKLKMSGAYQLVFFETLASSPKGSEERRLFEEIWEYALKYAKEKALEGDQTAKTQVDDVYKRIKEQRAKGIEYIASPKDDFFRYYSFIVVGAKDEEGGYMFRDRLYAIAERKQVKERYTSRVVELTRQTAKALVLEGSRRKGVLQLKQILMEVGLKNATKTPGKFRGNETKWVRRYSKSFKSK